MRNLQIPKKMKDIPKFEQTNNLKTNVFEIISFNDLSFKNINNKFYEEQTDLIFYKTHYCFITNLHNLLGEIIYIHNYGEDVSIHMHAKHNLKTIC